MIYFCLFSVALFYLASIPVFADNSTIYVSTSYRTLLSTPEQTGMLDRIIKEAFRRIDYKAEIVYTPTERSLLEVNDGLLDAEMNRIEGMEERFTDLVRVPEPNMQMHFVAFAKKEIPVSEWKSLKDLKVGIVSGWKIVESNTTDFTNLTRLVDEKQSFMMLERGRLDVVIYSKLNGQENIQSWGLKGIYPLEPPLISRDMFLYLNRRHAHLAEPLAQALRSMKADGAYDCIIEETCGNLTAIDHRAGKPLPLAPVTP